MHWIAGRWHLYPLLRPPATDGIELRAVTAVSSNDIRVVGWAELTPGDGVLDGDTLGVTFRWHAGTLVAGRGASWTPISRASMP